MIIKYSTAEITKVLSDDEVDKDPKEVKKALDESKKQVKNTDSKGDKEC